MNLISVPAYVGSQDFHEGEITMMIEGALERLGVKYYEGFPKEVFNKTEGHPCLTQKICGIIVDSLIYENRDYIQEEDLKNQVHISLDNYDITLQTTWESVKKNKNIDILKKVLKGEKIKYNGFDEFSYELKLAGAIVSDERGFCKIRNKIYYDFFSKQLG